ncbi:methyl-accepting chemotaxis protein [Herbaspirillum seropedicae]|uniref:methyl-accepting chemotaxis protein n=1 Tax=Herbaspirillum seropedicae TaxID=964 RepID=UPI003398EA38
MTIARKLYLLIVAVVLGVIMQAVVGLYQSHRIASSAGYSATNTIPSVLALNGATDAIYGIRLNIARYVIEPTAREKTVANMAALHQKAQDFFDQFERCCISDDTDRRMLEADRRFFAEYEKHRMAMVDLGSAGKEDALRVAMEEKMAPTGQRLMAVLNEHKNYNEQLGRQGAEAAAEHLQLSIYLTIAAATLVIVMVSVLSLLLVRNIRHSLHAATELADTIGRGDLSSQIVLRGRDEVTQLMLSLQRMTGSLVQILGKVNDSAATIETATREIASGNLDLSSRTEAQAGSLEETVSAMGQLTTTVKQNADNARQADELAQSASGVAGQAGKVVDEVILTMEAINASSLKIVDIISVIDGIAFQTNILALNAAVEAARAGEQGRGFAVVAAEVRTLAQRSAAAAREIKELIDDSVGKVASGSRLVTQAGHTMEEVVASVRRVTGIVTEISAASREQSEGLQQISQAISTMDESTQQNAALVEQAAAASQSLQDQAVNLAQVVGVFRLGRQAQLTGEEVAAQETEDCTVIAEREVLALSA